MFSGLLVDDFTPFIGSWGVWCSPIMCNQGLFVPLGWEDELDKRNISYELRNDLSNEEI